MIHRDLSAPMAAGLAQKGWMIRRECWTPGWWRRINEIGWWEDLFLGKVDKEIVDGLDADDTVSADWQAATPEYVEKTLENQREAFQRHMAAVQERVP